MIMKVFQNKKNYFVIKHDSYDLFSFKNIKENSEDLTKIEQENLENYPTISYLLQDIYSCFYKIKPKFSKKIDSVVEINKALIEEMIKTKEYKQLHQLTKLDEFGSAIATLKFAQEFLRQLTEEQKEEIKNMYLLQNEINNLQSEIDSLKDLLKKIPKGKNIKQRKQIGKKIKENLAKLKKLEGQIKKIDFKKGDLRRIARKSCDSARKDLEETQDLLDWGVDPGHLQKLPVEEKIKIANLIQNNSKLKKIAQIAGRFQRLAIYKQETKVKHGLDEIVDITIGNDLSKILPSELLLLSNFRTKLIFYKKFFEGQLLQYRFEGIEKRAKGPVICCVDNSGSMTEYFGSITREIWSKAFMLGLLTIAKKQGRNFAIIYFGSRDEIQQFSFENKNYPDPKKLIEILSFFFDGGTDFETPLNCAISYIEKQPNFKDADIIFITDGECQVSFEFLENFKKKKKDLNFKVYSILIGYAKNTLEDFSDEVFILEDLFNENEIIDRIYQI